MIRFLIYIMIYFSPIAVFAQTAQGESADSLEVKALLQEGDVHYKRFDNRLALDVYFKAYEKEPASYDVLSRLARTANDYALDLKADNKDQEAEQALEEALRYARALEQNFPQIPKTHIYLASIKKNLALLVSGRDRIEFGKDVESHCAKAMELNPDDPEVYITYAVFNRDIASMNWVERTLTSAIFGQLPEGSPQIALELLKKAIKINPLLHLAHYEIAVTYISLGLHDEAIPYLQNTLKLAAQTTQDNRNRLLADRMLKRIQQ